MQAQIHVRAAKFTAYSEIPLLLHKKFMKSFIFLSVWRKKIGIIQSWEQKKKPPKLGRLCVNRLPHGGRVDVLKTCTEWQVGCLHNALLLPTSSALRKGREVCKPRYEGASRFVNVGFNKSITHHAGQRYGVRKKRDYSSSSSSSNRYSMNCS